MKSVVDQVRDIQEQIVQKSQGNDALNKLMDFYENMKENGIAQSHKYSLPAIDEQQRIFRSQCVNTK